MSLYQRKRLSTGENVGEPGPLPADLVGGLSDEDLARLGRIVPPEAQAEYGDAAFVPIAPPPPQPPRWISQALFLERMTAQKRIPIRVAAKTDPIIEDFLGVLSATVEVYLDDPNLAQGLAYLVSQNLLTNADVAALTA